MTNPFIKNVADYPAGKSPNGELLDIVAPESTHPTNNQFEEVDKRFKEELTKQFSEMAAGSVTEYELTNAISILTPKLLPFLHTEITQAEERGRNNHRELLANAGYAIETIRGYVAEHNYEQAENHLKVLSQTLLESLLQPQQKGKNE